MKKLLIGACVAMLGIAAHASSVTWGLATGQTLDATKVASGTMYLVYTADATGIDWTKLEGLASFDESTIASVGFEKTVTSFTYSAEKINNKETITPASTGLAAGSLDMYMICINEGGTALAYTTTAKPVNVKATALSVTATVLATAFTYAEAGAVPEPTSGLLLLVGLAGLALKRKVA